jgi:hypothetical protein
MSYVKVYTYLGRKDNMSLENERESECGGWTRGDRGDTTAHGSKLSGNGDLTPLSQRFAVQVKINSKFEYFESQLDNPGVLCLSNSSGESVT